MNRYDNYSPEIPDKEEVPPVETIAPEAPVRRRRPAKRTAATKIDKNADAPSKSRRVKKEPKDDDSIIEEVNRFFHSTSLRLIAGIVLGCLGIYLAVAFISYLTECIKDQAAIANAAIGAAKNVGNAAGEGGARLAEFLINETFGLGSFVIIVWLICISLKLLIRRPKFKTINFTCKCLVALITLSLIVGVLTLSLNSPVNWGGYHGRYVNEFLIHFLGWYGAVILCLMCVAIFVVICLRDFVKWIIRKKNMIVEKQRRIREHLAEKRRLEQELAEMRRREAEDAVKAGEDASQTEESAPKDDVLKFSNGDSGLDSTIVNASDYTVEADIDTYYLEDEPEEPKESVKNNSINVRQGLSDDNKDASYASAEEEDPSEKPDHNDDSAAEDKGDKNLEKSTVDSSEKESSETAMVVNVNQIAQSDGEMAYHDSACARLYKFPSTDLLLPGNDRISVDEDEQEDNKRRIEETLLYHGIPITSITATAGPTVTLYEIRPDQGIKIAKIKALADDIAMSLSAVGVRIIAPIPGKGTVGIEVANNEPQTVSMRTIINSKKFAETRYRLPVAIGSTIGNDVYLADLTKMPHLLVAGATGQGKSVGLNAIIASLLYKKRPDELKFVMIDPKEVEFSLYAKIEKHYLAKIPGEEEAIVTDMSKVVSTLSSLCVEMDNRYKLLRTANVRNVEEYNEKIAQKRLLAREGHRFLPYIVVVVDEFADLIMTSGKEVETPIARLAQKARAIGIHVIIATQRPSTNVITGLIKANFPVRIAFKVSSGVDSKTILDTTGAQHLIGRGDMLISSNSQMVRVQCAFIDTPEVEAICDYISKQPFNAGAYLLPEPQGLEGMDGGNNGSNGGGFVSDRDPLLEEALRYIVESNTASTSALQRHFSIGYNRAGKIMDQLEYMGYVGPAFGGKPRDLKIGMMDLEAALNNIRS